MKVTALLVLKCGAAAQEEATVLANASDVSHFGYFQRGSAKEFIVFVARTIAKRTPAGQRQSVEQEGLLLYSTQRENACCNRKFIKERKRFEAEKNVDLMVLLWLDNADLRVLLWLKNAGLRDEKNAEYMVHAYNRNGLCGVAFVDAQYPMRSAFSVLTKVLDEYQKAFGNSWQNVQSDNSDTWPYLDEALGKYQDPTEADKLLKIQKELDETKHILHKTIDSVLERGEKLDSLVEKSSDLSLASQVFYKQAKKTNQCCTIL
ncbi:hypothetical protein L7F22_024653 [Adiantum nelumboides]|nr:hypothetical protein [Adiantum nelumboides]